MSVLTKLMDVDDLCLHAARPVSRFIGPAKRCVRVAVYGIIHLTLKNINNRNAYMDVHGVKKKKIKKKIGDVCHKTKKNKK